MQVSIIREQQSTLSPSILPLQPAAPHLPVLQPHTTLLPPQQLSPLVNHLDSRVSSSKFRSLQPMQTRIHPPLQSTLSNHNINHNPFNDDRDLKSTNILPTVHNNNNNNNNNNISQTIEPDSDITEADDALDIYI
jgi:hypothetical protein